MKAARFDFVRAGSLAEATRLLLEANGDARLVAGAQSIGPMLNLRLARPSLLIDITGIPDLTRIEDGADAVTLGACVTTANVEDGRLPGPGLDPLRGVAARIAYRAVRNRGTVGGSLCHADPAADWVCVLCALDAECLVSGARGKRRLPADQFVLAAYESALAPGEVLEAITLPRLSRKGRLAHVKICRKAGDFALAMCAVLNDPERRLLRIVIGATNGRPIVLGEDAVARGAKGIDEGEVLRLLERNGIAGQAARRQVAALARAHDQATNP
jgi:carbon-monoxide dehydrogenase medium subunit